MNSTKKNKTSVVILVIVMVVLVAVIVALVGFCYSLYKDSQEKQPDSISEQVAYAPSGVSIVVTEDNRDVLQEIKDKVAFGMIEVKMTSNWVFEENCTVSNAYLANSKRNDFDLRFLITLADTGEVIMESPDVPIGSCIENFPLEVVLEPGEYDVIVAHQQVKDGEVFNTVRTTASITVK